MTGEARAKRMSKERDGNCCVDCGMTEDEHIRYFARTLHQHRIVPSQGYVVANLVTVCNLCHAMRHGADNFRVNRLEMLMRSPRFTNKRGSTFPESTLAWIKGHKKNSGKSL
jgi:hypothetical protein